MKDFESSCQYSIDYQLTNNLNIALISMDHLNIMHQAVFFFKLENKYNLKLTE